MRELKKDAAVWENYRRFPEPYRRIRVAYIDAARKRPEEFRRRLDDFIEKTRDLTYYAIERSSWEKTVR